MFGQGVNQQLLANTAAEAILWPEKKWDVGTTPLVIIYGGINEDDPLTAAVASQSATLDSFDEDVAADATVGQLELTLDATTNLKVGRRYWLSNEKRRTQEVECAGYDASKIYLVSALDIAATAAGTPTPTLSSHRLSVTVPASALGELFTDGRIIFTYTYQGSLVTEVVMYDVVVQKYWLPVTRGDMLQEFPEWGDYAGTDVEWRQLLRGAQVWTERLLRRGGLNPDIGARNPQALKAIVMYQMIVRYFQVQAGDFSRQLVQFKEARDFEIETLHLDMFSQTNKNDALSIAYEGTS